jgi:hypothetical protein
MSSEFTDTATAVEEVAIGAAQTAAEVASDPVGSARRQVKGFARKGTPAARRINRRLNALMPDQLTIMGLEVNGKLPEKIAIRGLHVVKVQARRQDVVGDVAKRTLRIFNASFKTIARTASRFEQASELTPRREPSSATRATRTRAGTTRTRAGSTRRRTTRRRSA